MKLNSGEVAGAVSPGEIPPLDGSAMEALERLYANLPLPSFSNPAGGCNLRSNGGAVSTDDLRRVAGNVAANATWRLASYLPSASTVTAGLAAAGEYLFYPNATNLLPASSNTTLCNNTALAMGAQSDHSGLSPSTIALMIPPIVGGISYAAYTLYNRHQYPRYAAATEV